MPKVPGFLLKKLYVKRSLDTDDDGFWFKIKNVLAEATLTKPVTLTVDGETIDPEDIYIFEDDEKISMEEVEEKGMDITLALQEERKVWVEYDGGLDIGNHTLAIESTTDEYGDIKFKVKDEI